MCSLSALRHGPTLQPTGLKTSVLNPDRPGETQVLDQRSLLSQIGRRSIGARAGASKNDVILSSALLQPDRDILSSPVADTSVEDSDHASAASTVPLLVTLLSIISGLRLDLPRRRRKGRSCKSSWPVQKLPTSDTDLGKRRRKPSKHSPRCTRALMRALDRSRWLNGLCRGLHRGCTDGTGPRPSVEP